MRLARLVGAVIVSACLTVAVGCVAPLPSSDSSTPTSSGGPSADQSVTAEPASASPQPAAAAAITPVSRSHPTAEEAEVLRLCDAERVGLARVTGMGEIPRARDAALYVDLWGVEPEIQNDNPAWFVVLAGRVDFARYWAVDPVCMVVDGKTTMFAPHEHGRGDRSEFASPPARAPSFVGIPPLAP